MTEKKDLNDLAVELGGVRAVVNAFSLQYAKGAQRLGEEEAENALFAICRQLDRIKEDLEELYKESLTA